MLRLCDIREKIVDKVKAIKNYRKNSGPDFYYIYNGTEKKGDKRKENFKLHHSMNKIVDKVKATKYIYNSTDFYYIYNGTEKNGDERKENFNLHHLKQDLIRNHQNKTLGTSKIRKSIGDTPTVSVYS